MSDLLRRVVCLMRGHAPWLSLRPEDHAVFCPRCGQVRPKGAGQ